MSDRQAMKSGPQRIWFYKPTLWWYGWRTLVPFWRGSDEYGRRTAVIGWNFLGQVVIAYGRPDPLGDPFFSSPVAGPE